MDQGDHRVKYTLSGEGAGSIFTIDEITGDIYVLMALDRSVLLFKYLFTYYIYTYINIHILN